MTTVTGASEPATNDHQRVQSTTASVVNCTGAGGGCAGMPATATITPMTLESPPSGAGNGGLNSSVLVTLGGPLANGNAVNVSFTLAIQQAGGYRVFVNVEALP